MMKITASKTTVAFLKSKVTRRLFPNDVAFSHLAFVGERQVAFRMQPISKAGEIFGLGPVAQDSIIATAFYDMTRQCACYTLELTVNAAGREYRYEYLLTKDERRMLCEKMKDFFLQRVGTELLSFSLERLAASAVTG